MSGSSDYTTTPNLGLFKPNYDMDDGAWGGHLNTNADTLDSAIHALQTTLAGGVFLPIAGGTMTGAVTLAGISTAPTAAPGTSTTQLANTAFVAALVAAQGGVTSFNTRAGVVTLTLGDVTGVGGAPLASPALTGNPTAPTPAPGDADTSVATTAFVAAAIAPLAPASAIPVASNSTPAINGTAVPGSGTAFSRSDHVHPTDTTRAATSALASYLPLSGGTLTGPLFGTAAQFSSAVTVNGNLNAAANILVTSNGKIDINASTGNYSMHTFSQNGATVGQVYANNTTNDFFIQNVITTTALILNSPSGAFTSTSGTAYKPGGGSWTDNSDARIKTVQSDYSAGLDEVLQLRPVVYSFKGNDTPGPDVNAALGLADDQPKPNATQAPYPGSYHFKDASNATLFVGLIAQEVEVVFPEMVKQHEGYIDGAKVTDLRDVDTSALIFALVNAVKTLASRLTALEAQ